jgi:lysophospholipase L1-like esterase
MRVILRQAALLCALCTLWYVLVAGLSLVGVQTPHFADLGYVIGKRFAGSGPQTGTVNALISTQARPQQPLTAELHSDTNESRSIELLLPPAIYAVPEVPMAIYYDNIILSRQSEDYRFSVNCNCKFGNGFERRRWIARPTEADVGDYPLTVTVTDWSSNVIATATTTLHVTSTKAGENQNLRMLIVGDSITSQNFWPNQVARLLSQPSNPKWFTIGETHPQGSPPFGEGTLPGVAHEGIPGWAWSLFANFYDLKLAKDYHRERSPFIFLEPDGSKRLDIARYFREKSEGQPADVVVFQLGINDTFTANPDDPVSLDQSITAMLGNINLLLEAFKVAHPTIALGITLPMSFTNSEQTFQFSYSKLIKDYPRWRHRRIQHRVVQRLIEHYKNRERDGIFLIPTYTNFDVIDGYPIDNAGHPAELGHHQFAASVYSWLKWWMASKPYEEKSQENNHVSGPTTPQALSLNAPLSLILPPHLYATQGLESSIYFDNIILKENIEDLQFSVLCSCKAGKVERRRWVIVPDESLVGEHQIAISVADLKGNILASGSMSLRVASARTGEGHDIELFLVGDSIMRQQWYPNRLARLLSQPGNPAWSMIGTVAIQKPSSYFFEPALPGVKMEAYNGWPSYYFFQDDIPDTRHLNPETSARWSPFLYEDSSAHRVFDLKRYFRENANGRPPDVAIFLLGTNDIFVSDPTNPELFAYYQAQFTTNMDKLLAEFQHRFPSMTLAIATPPPFAEASLAYKILYGEIFTYERQKHVHRKNMESMFKHFAKREHENIFLIPTNISFDAIDGYHISQVVHPSEYGHRQVADTIYSWLKWWLAQYKESGLNVKRDGYVEGKH